MTLRIVLMALMPWQPARVCRLDAKPLRAVSMWVREYEAFWSESLRGLKNYIEKT